MIFKQLLKINMSKIIQLIFTILILLVGTFLKMTTTQAQTNNFDLNSINLQGISNDIGNGSNISKEPLENFWNLLKNIKIFSPHLTLNIPGGIFSSLGVNVNNGNASFDSTKLSSNLNLWWGKINNWFGVNVGVTLGQIIKVVLEIVIWIWQIIIELLKGLMAKL